MSYIDISLSFILLPPAATVLLQVPRYQQTLAWCTLEMYSFNICTHFRFHQKKKYCIHSNSLVHWHTMYIHRTTYNLKDIQYYMYDVSKGNFNIKGILLAVISVFYCIY